MSKLDRWWDAVDQWLTPRRLSYAWIAGAVMWSTWLVTIMAGDGAMDVLGRPIGTDFLQFYTAGLTLRLGQQARLYDFAYQSELQRSLMGPQLDRFYAFITPPHLAWIFVPLSALPYAAAFLIWSAIGLVGLVIGLRWLGAGGWRPLGWALTFFPVFAAISYGQNSLLSFLLMATAGMLWLRGHDLAAGLALSGLAYKPQLILGLAILWVADGRRSWRALVGLVAGMGGWLTLTQLLMPDAWRNYVVFARTVLPGLPHWGEFPLWHLHTVRGFWWLLFPQATVLADLLTAISAVAGLALAWRVWRSLPLRSEESWAVAVLLTLWLTPHAMIYDWAILLIPAVLLWRTVRGPMRRWRVAFALVWAATWVSGPVTALQMRWLPIAIQWSIPIYAFACWQVYRQLVGSDGGDRL